MVAGRCHGGGHGRQGAGWRSGSAGWRGTGMAWGPGRLLLAHLAGLVLFGVADAAAAAAAVLTRWVFWRAGSATELVSWGMQCEHDGCLVAGFEGEVREGTHSGRGAHLLLKGAWW